MYYKCACIIKYKIKITQHKKMSYPSIIFKLGKNIKYGYLYISL